MSTKTITETRGPFPFSGPAAGADENPAAHGGACWVDIAEDGSRRERNVNGQHEEVGAWQQAQHRRA